MADETEQARPSRPAAETPEARLRQWVEGYRTLSIGGGNLDANEAHSAWVGGENTPRVLLVDDLVSVLDRLERADRAEREIRAALDQEGAGA